MLSTSPEGLAKLPEWLSNVVDVNKNNLTIQFNNENNDNIDTSFIIKNPSSGLNLHFNIMNHSVIKETDKTYSFSNIDTSIFATNKLGPKLPIGAFKASGEFLNQIKEIFQLIIN